MEDRYFEINKQLNEIREKLSNPSITLEEECELACLENKLVSERYENYDNPKYSSEAKQLIEQINKYLYNEGEKEMKKSTIEMEENTWSLNGEAFKVALDETGIKLKMRIKYFEGATKLQKITKGNWIDVYANKDVFVMKGERAMIPLGFALELPQGWEGHLAPRSSTFKTWGIIQTNHVGVVDDTYIGDNDQWHMPVYCLQDKEYRDEKNNDYTEGTWIRQGDKIGQFRVMEVMPEIEFEEVDTFGNADRGGFGTSGTR